MSNIVTEKENIIKYFNLDLQRNLCLICQKIGQTTENIKYIGRCEKHKHIQLCINCDRITSYSYICISCLSGDLK